jgi:hypothetical protein
MVLVVDLHETWAGHRSGSAQRGRISGDLLRLELRGAGLQTVQKAAARSAWAAAEKIARLSFFSTLTNHEQIIM